MARASSPGVRAWWQVMVVAAVVLFPTRSRAGDRLNAARQEAGASSPRAVGSGGSSVGSDSSWDDDDDDDDGLLSAILGLFAEVADEDDPAGDPLGVESPQVLDERRGFLPYPYADRRDGYMVRAAPGSQVDEDTRHVVLRFGAEGAFLYEDVWRSSAQLRVMMPRFYVQGRYDLLLEGPTAKLDGDVEVQGTVRDRLHFANVELGPQFSAGERLAVRFGVVGNLMFDDRRSLPVDPTVTPGLGAAAEFDLYPVRPLVISGRGAVMRLGDTVFMEARGTLGVSFNRAEVFAGYDHRLVGDVPLGGPLVGAAIRF